MIRRLILAALLLAPSTAIAAAPEPPAAELRVTVLDQTGAALVTATVTVTSDAGAQQTWPVDDKGVVVFRGLTAGTWRVTVHAEAFQSYDGPVTLKKGSNAVSVRLPLANLNEEVVVRQDESDRRGNSFVQTLEPAEIAELPDDPDELEQVLMQMAGPGAVLRVNGFRGGQLPPKSQIRQIRFRMNSYAAENHDAGGIGIDVLTKPGLDAWRGMSTFSFRDESLNARNAFADTVGPEQYRRAGLNFNGPLVKGRTSLAVATNGNFSYDSETLNAQTPDGKVNGQVRRPSDISNVTVRVEHTLTTTQMLLVEVQRHDDERRNLGVGEFDLPSRAYQRNNQETVLRGSLNGLVAPKIANELRAQYSGEEATTSSASFDPAVIVIDAFADGGAGQKSRRRTRSLEIDDNVDFSFSKKHAVRAGLSLEADWYDSLDERNANGTFTFASLNAYEIGQANTYTARTIGTPIAFGQYQLGVYVQDDWTPSKAFSLSLGLRQELQNTLSDRVNLAPRVGFTWALGSFTVRGGYGIFNDWYDSSLHEQTLLVNGENQSDVVVQLPGYPDPYSGAVADVLPPSVVLAARGLLMPYVQQASIGVERSWGDFRVQASYMRQRGDTALRSRNVNAPVPGSGRPNPSIGNEVQIESAGRLAQDRLHVNVNYRNQERRFFTGINYTLSSTKNDSDSPLSLPSNSLDPGVDYGPSGQDARHRLFAIASFGLPLKLRTFWMSQFVSALPYTIITGLDNNFDSVTNDRPAGVGRNSARGSASWNLNARLSRAFTFGPPREGDQGPVGPGGGPIRMRGGRGDGDGGPRVMMSSLEPDAGRYSIELYVQAFNLLNHTNFTTYGGSLRSPFFGEPVSAAPARRIELGVQFGF
jgi:hypothetical protein